jgi:hypothetical protein
MISSVVFKSGPSYFACAKSITLNNHHSDCGVLILSEKSLSLWSGASLDFNSDAQDMNEMFSMRLRQIQGRLDDTTMVDMTSNSKLGYAWVLACSRGPTFMDNNNRGNQSMGYSNYLSMHRVAVTVGGNLHISTNFSHGDGNEDIFLIDLNEHQPSEVNRMFRYTFFFFFFFVKVLLALYIHIQL